MKDAHHPFRAACTEGLPLAIAIAAYGLSYGVLATQAKLSLLATLAMSLLVFSGSVQLVAVAMLLADASWLSIIVTAVLLSLRNLLYGAALAEGLSPAKKWNPLLAFGVTDEPFVLGMARFKQHGPDPLYFGLITAMFYGAWAAASLLGALLGNRIDPYQWGLDLAFPVTFIALVLPALVGKPVIATALTAVLLTLGLEFVLPGNEYTIISVGLIAPLAGLWQTRRERHA